MNNNIEFTYLYRDADNYKSWGNVIFSNSEKISILEIELEMRNLLIDNEFFIASKIRVPEVFLYDNNKLTLSDHSFHEFYSLKYTNKEPNDIFNRPFMKFLAELEKQ